MSGIGLCYWVIRLIGKKVHLELHMGKIQQNTKKPSKYRLREPLSILGSPSTDTSFYSAQAMLAPISASTTPASPGSADSALS